MFEVLLFLNLLVSIKLAYICSVACTGSFKGLFTLIYHPLFEEIGHIYTRISCSYFSSVGSTYLRNVSLDVIY